MTRSGPDGQLIADAVGQLLQFVAIATIAFPAFLSLHLITVQGAKMTESRLRIFACSLLNLTDRQSS